MTYIYWRGSPQVERAARRPCRRPGLPGPPAWLKTLPAELSLKLLHTSNVANLFSTVSLFGGSVGSCYALGIFQQTQKISSISVTALVRLFFVFVESKIAGSLSRSWHQLTRIVKASEILRVLNKATGRSAVQQHSFPLAAKVTSRTCFLFSPPKRKQKMIRQ